MFLMLYFILMVSKFTLLGSVLTEIKYKKLTSFIKYGQIIAYFRFFYTAVVAILDFKIFAFLSKIQISAYFYATLQNLV